MSFDWKIEMFEQELSIIVATVEGPEFQSLIDSKWHYDVMFCYEENFVDWGVVVAQFNDFFVLHCYDNDFSSRHSYYYEAIR